MNYKIISSGSDGNATIIEKIILIDCGVSFASLKDYLEEIKIILLTHIHRDHFNKSTIKKIARERPNTRFACGEWLVRNLVECGVDKKNIDVLKIGKLYNYNTFKISSIKAYHDVSNCGWRIYLGDKKALYITDTSTLDGIKAKDYDLYLVEANYEEEDLKRRIKEKRENKEFAYELRVEDTHLSKEQCVEFFLENSNSKSELVFMHQHIDKVKKVESKEE